MAKKKVQKASNKVNWEFPLTKKNLIFGGIGIGILLIGYLLMATGIGGEYAAVDGTWNNPLAIVVSPLLLVFAYLVVIPYAIFKSFPDDSQ